MPVFYLVNTRNNLRDKLLGVQQMHGVLIPTGSAIGCCHSALMPTTTPRSSLFRVLPSGTFGTADSLLTDSMIVDKSMFEKFCGSLVIVLSVLITVLALGRRKRRIEHQEHRTADPTDVLPILDGSQLLAPGSPAERHKRRLDGLVYREKPCGARHERD